MGGYRCRRATVANSQCSNQYVSANGDLILPWEYSQTKDDGVNGVFPEFFYGFYNDDHNISIDVGVMYRGTSGWRVFAYGDSMQDPFNTEHSISLSPGQKIEIAAYVGGTDQLVCRVNGKEYVFPMVSGHSANIKKYGCQINRELNLVSQSVANSCSVLKTGSYFTGASWGNTTLEHKYCGYVFMDDSNSVYDNNMDKDDSTIYDSACIIQSHVNTGSGIYDYVSIDFRKRSQCRN